MSKLKFAFAPSIQPCLCVVKAANYMIACHCSWNRSSCGVKGTYDDGHPFYFLAEAGGAHWAGMKKPLSFRQLSGTMAGCVLMLCISVPTWSSVSCSTSLSKAPCVLCAFLCV